MREKRRKRKNDLKTKILEHIYKNLKAYIVVIMIFIIGITAGVIFINNAAEDELTEIQSYVTNFIDSINQGSYIDKTELLRESLFDDLILILSMWFAGSTAIGIPIVFAILIYRGFCIGYTVSAIIAVLGTQKGVTFLLATILLQNIIFIPVIIVMTVSCIKLYKSIMKDKRRENIKIEIIRHTFISIILLIFLAISSLVEVYISTNILTMIASTF